MQTTDAVTGDIRYLLGNKGLWAGMGVGFPPVASHSTDYPFSVPISYTYDPTKIEVNQGNNGLAQFYVSKTLNSTAYDFTPGNYSYDSGSIAVSASTSTVHTLVVAGGGGGGSRLNRGGGGGGGGGVVYDSSHSISVGSYTITVGAGGTGAYNGSIGGNSSFDTIIAYGGGAGASDTPGGSGGSGGGSAGVGGSGGTATSGQGYNGGAGGGTCCKYGGGGGGGASAVGGNGSYASGGGNGGAGVANSITGSSVYYGGGGGGGGAWNNAGSGGVGGGGNGSQTSGVRAGSGTANTGGGGGGANTDGDSNAGGDGGSGVVIISYPTGSFTATGGTITTSGGNTIHTFTSSGTFTVTGGAALVNRPAGGNQDWNLTTSSEYTYNASKITVSGSAASLYTGSAEFNNTMYMTSDPALLEYYKMQDTNATINSAYNLTNTGSTPFTNGAADFGTTNGQGGKALRVANNLGLSVNADRTIMLWLKMNTELSGGDTYPLIMKLGYPSEKVSYGMGYVRVGGVNYLQVFRGTACIGAPVVSTATNLGTSSWHHLALTTSGTTLTGYLDGQSIGSVTVGTGGGSCTEVNGISFGPDGVGNNGVAALMDDAAFYNRALTATEINNIYTMSNGLDAYYRLDGNSTDQKGAYNGSDTGITYSSGNGKYGQGAGFNGTSSQISLGNGLDFNGPITIAGWIKNDDASYSKWGPIISKRNSSGTKYQFGINMGDGKLHFYNGNTVYSSGSAVGTNWTHVAMTLSSNTNGTLRFYKNGVQDGGDQTGVSLGSGSSSLPVLFGHNTDGGSSEWFTGKMDDVVFYQRALSQSEITMLYTGSAAGYPTDNPTILTNTAYSAPSATAWSSFTETATKPSNTAISYQISSDNGSTYYWWNGSAWATSDGTVSQANSATDINSHISTFGLGTKQFKWKAFLSSTDGVNTPILDNVNVAYVVVPSGYSTADPVVTRTAVLTVSNLSYWYSFTETATKASGSEIYYQLSNDGTNWKWWNGTAWTVAGTAINTANTATQLTTSVMQAFPTSGGNTLYWRAYLHSTGNACSLSGVTVGYYVNSIGSATVRALVVAGGGGGGSSSTGSYGGGGGGGAGGYQYDAAHTVSAQTYTVTVGAGGAGTSANAVGSNGGNSVFDTMTSIGGGGGGAGGTGSGGSVGVAGGSGGGGGVNSVGGAGTSGQGNSGGSGVGDGGYNCGAGGGGSSAVGVHTTPYSSAGGAGTSNSITGSAVTYATGGYGSEATGSGTRPGVANTGNGGGGNHNGASGSGGSGVVIISYPTGTLTATGGTITTSGGYTIHTFTSNGTFTVTAINIYPTSKPTIFPTTSASATILQSWDGFIESATKNGGEIYYQLSDDDGTTWKWWNGSAWAAVATGTDYNTATDVNTHIGAFPTTSKKLMWKAFLVSNGSQQIQLDTVTVTYTGTQ